MKVNQLKAGVIISYLQMALSVLISLLYTPVMLKLLGDSEYGLYNTVASTVSMLSILSLGLNSGYVRYFSQYRQRNEKERIYSLNGLYFIVLSVIGIIALLCGAFLTCNLDLVFKDGLTHSEYETARILMIILTANLSLSFPMGVFSNIISAHERFVFLRLLSVIKTVASPLVTLPLMLIGFRSIGVVTVTLIFSVLTDALYMYYVFFVLKDRFVFRNFEKGLFRSIFSYTAFIALNMIIDQINNNLGKVIIARYLGTVQVAVYSVGFTLYSYYLTFSSTVSAIFTPRVHKIVNEFQHDKKLLCEKQTDLFIKVGRIQYFILALISSGFIFFGMDFITKLWISKTGYEDAFYVSVMLMIPVTIPLIQNVGIEMQRAQNKHKFRSIVYLFMALINVAVSVILCRRFGIIGCTVGTSVSFVLFNGVILNIYYQKRCYINVLRFWKSILLASRSLILPIVFGIIMTNIFRSFSITGFICRILAYSAVYCLSVWLFGLNEREKQLLLTPFKKIFKKQGN